jgi:hypothetical protein
VDLGSGSESVLWAIALRAQQLTAVDTDPERLVILRDFTATGRPRGVHRTALALCGRTPQDFARRCRSLHATVTADCLTGLMPAHPCLAEGETELLTQFGLLGLCRDERHFTTCFTSTHRLLTPGGWAAGANWVPRDLAGRVALDEPLYRQAAARTGIHLQLIQRLPSADPDFPAVWIYIGRKAQP